MILNEVDFFANQYGWNIDDVLKLSWPQINWLKHLIRKNGKYNRNSNFG